VGKNGEKRAYCRPINRYISETVKDRHTVTTEDRIRAFSRYEFRWPWARLVSDSYISCPSDSAIANLSWQFYDDSCTVSV